MRMASHPGPGLPDRGSAAVELVLITPFLLMLVLLAVGAGRLAGARMDVEDAAHQAARAASLARSPDSAGTAARQTAGSALSQAGTSCPDPQTAVDTAGFHPGGQVTVTVSCTVALSDLGAVPLPGHQTITGAFTSPLDTYTSDAP